MSKLEYTRPIINIIDIYSSGKYGSIINQNKVLKEINGKDIKELVKKYGSPLFVFDEKSIIEKYKEFEQAFKSRYPKVQFWWSYKTNYLNGICNVFHKLGSKAEVVSEFEYEKAIHNGIKGEDIIFNGPYKPKKALLKAVKEKAKIHIDHWDEINILEEIADELGVEIPVAIRCNMDTKMTPQWSRFGFNIDNGEAYEAIKRIYQEKKLILNGLHSHIGTFVLSSSPYSEEVKKLVLLKNKVEKDFGYKIEYIDIGGGFASKNRLKGIYQSPEVIVPTPEEYAESISSTIFKYNENELPYLYLETGRALIDEAGYLLSTIVASKRLPDGKISYIIDAGVNLLYTNFWYDLTIFLNREEKKEELKELSIINGPLCMNIDVIKDNINLPPLENGDILTLYPVGAYTITQSMQFIRYRPAVLLIKEDGTEELIRKPDDLAYVQEKETL